MVLASDNKKLKICGCFLQRFPKYPPLKTGIYGILYIFANKITQIENKIAFVLKTSTIINLHDFRCFIMQQIISHKRCKEFSLSDAVTMVCFSDKDNAKSSIAVGFSPCLDSKFPINSITFILQKQEKANNMQSRALKFSLQNETSLRELIY